MILHYALPSPLSAALREHRGRRVLLHHNITPPEFFVGWDEEMVRICARGREELKTLVGHVDLALADSETTSALRLRKLLVEDHPLIQGYDQEAWAIRLRYTERETAPALEAFRAARATTMQLRDASTSSRLTRHTSARFSRHTAASYLFRPRLFTAAPSQSSG